MYVDGIGVVPAERSFTHDVGSVLGTDENTVFATDMHTKNADGTLIDLSGNSNHGTINGAVRSSGYFRDWMRFNGVNNTIVIDDDDVFDVQEFHIKMIFEKLGTPTTYERLISKNDGTSVRQFDAHITTSNRLGFNFGDTGVYSDNMIASGKMCVVDCILYNSELYIYTNGILDSVHDYDVIVPYTDTDMYIGNFEGLSRYFNGTIYMVTIATSIPSESDVGGEYNKLASLPLYTFDFSKYPSNITVYDDFLPYSSARISSGSFKVNDDKLECVTDGQIVFRNAHEFDGDEYIKLTIDDTVYAGTGTITQGTTTASIEQGSTLITVDMVAGDTIDSIDIQFREPVDE
jgi:hypothetical protein